ncbi:MAG TPA: pilus assembly protein TadG-related protein [Actinomycetota bacterium]|nr:pilus assembly protein TadG-related protein [Actinomycetota bacterium]
MRRLRAASDERGAVVVIVAIVAVVLFGFVALAVDAARIYAERSELQRTADAAALSGAQAAWQGPDPSAVARRFIEENPTPYHHSPTGADVVSCSGAGCSVEIGVEHFELLFAGVLGFGDTSLSASATAELKAGTPGGDKLIPWGIIDCLSPEGGPASCASLSGGQEIALSFGTAEQRGNLVGVGLPAEGSCPQPSGAFSGTGYEEFLSGRGLACEIGKGASLTTLAEPAEVLQARTAGALSSRLAGCSSFDQTVSIDASGFAHVRHLDDPCLVAVPIVADPGAAEPGVSQQVTVTRLALLYFTRTQPAGTVDGPAAVYEGVLLQGLFSAKAGMDEAPCESGDGVCVVKLTE